MLAEQRRGVPRHSAAWPPILPLAIRPDWGNDGGMKTISNKTRVPLKISLSGGRTLHLGPLKTGQISDDRTNDASIQRLVKEGKIELGGNGASSRGQGGPIAVAQEATHGHAQPTVVLPKGNR
jgi:hypothetical protein